VKRATVLFLNHTSVLLGGERGLLDIVKALDPVKYRSLAVLPEPGRLGPRLEAAGAAVGTMPIRRFRRTRNPVRILFYAASVARVAPRLTAMIRRERVSLIHSNSNTAHIYGAVAAASAGIPCVWHCRDLVDLGLAGRWMARRATRIIGISAAVSRHLAERAGAAAKCVTVLNATDTEEFRPRACTDATRAALGIAPGRFVVAMAGQLVPWKKHGLFLQAAAVIARDVPRATFLIAGADSFGDHPGYRESLVATAGRLGLGERLRFAGHQEDMAGFLSAVDVLVHPADREPFGRVILEAMAMERAVVAVNACGPAEIVRNGLDGILVNPDSPDAIADAVARLAAEPDLARALGTAARERVEKDFGLARLGAEIGNVYESVL
jgi:glycosyltransferase involved in cell wall biosynthesis